MKNTISHIKFLLKGGSFAITQKNKRKKKISKRVKKTQGTYGTSTRGSIYTLLEKRESLFEEIMAKTSYI